MSLRHPAFLAVPIILLGGGAHAAGFGPVPHPAAQPAPAIQTVQQTVIIAPSLPPAPRVETVPPPPPPGPNAALWRPGHWNWTGTDWAWVSGRYVVPPAPTQVWTPGRWVAHPEGGYQWIPGHWRSNS